MENYADAQAFPLTWPAGWKRTRARMKTPFREHSLDSATRYLMNEIRLLGGTKVVLSTNIPIRKDGLPYSGYRQPDDVGAAIYFVRKGRPQCVANDQYRKVEDNVYALARTVEAIRAIERWGSSEMLDRAFTGFTALPAPANMEPPQEWWQVLEQSAQPPRTAAWFEQMNSTRRELLRKYHPDVGDVPDSSRAAKINAAWAQAQKYFEGAR